MNIAIVPARMGSKRLPGKVMMEIAGKPMLWHVIHRLKKCKRVDRIVVTTPDVDIVSYATELVVDSFAGSEDDVLSRFVGVSEKYYPDIIVRVTGDAPLIDPVTIDRMIEGLGYYDYVELDKNTVHEGFEVFSLGCLVKLWEMRSDPYVREHVSGAVRKYRDQFDINVIPAEEKHLGNIKTSIDTMEDLEFIRGLYKESGAEAGELDIADV